MGVGVTGQPDTRAKLIAGAFAVVAREGLDKASVKAIAAEAGVTPGLLHYHFPTKDALLKAAMMQGLDDYRQRLRHLRETEPPDRIVDAFFDMSVAFMASDADVFRVRLPFAARAIADPELAVAMQAMTDEAIELIALVLAAANGTSVPSPQHRVMAKALKATFDGIMLASLIDPHFPQDQIAQLFRSAVSEWLTHRQPPA